MAATVGVPRESCAGERRVALTPKACEALAKAKLQVIVERSAGQEAGFLDEEYVAKGAQLGSRAEVFAAATVIVQAKTYGSNPDHGAEDLPLLRPGQLLIGFGDPLTSTTENSTLASAGVSFFAMELVPRITRAQAMDALSSMASIAGYEAVLIAAAALPKIFPMMMTAAGTITPAKVLILGAGVAGLQAIATARRLGAIVTATDVRPATKEQVESLGAKFVAVEDDEFKQAETAGGYAKEMSADYKAKQAALVSAHIAKQDIVITTALIPGRPAPRLISADMVHSMRAGSVIIDLAVERGGNCELALPGETVITDNGVRIVGHLNVPGRLAATASSLYARNLLAFVETLVDKDTKGLAPKWDDELVKATLLTRDGAVVHPNFLPK